MAERTLDAQRVADEVATGMLKNDRASRALGMQVAAIGPGSATLTSNPKLGR